MIHIVNKSDCCGCAACVQCCTKQCIQMQNDHEGFCYPVVDQEKCVSCGLCDKVCPIINSSISQAPQKVYAAINQDEPTRLNSSSGGIFTLLAKQTINAGGVVFGAKYDNNWQVIFDYAETLEELTSLQGSKYVQAQIGTSYRQAEGFLKQGRKVMFSGTPCQISGLKHFLRKDYENLFTVDIVCHGIPSPKVWNRYLTELNYRLKRQSPFKSSPQSSESSPISAVSFRDKTSGWKKYAFVVYGSFKEEDSKETSKSILYFSPHRKETFIRAFRSNMILRPSCYSCPFKDKRSGADISIGDFWGIGKISPEMDDDKGTSVIIVWSEKGLHSLPYDRMLYNEYTFEDAERHNAGLKNTCIPHPRREEFFAQLDSCKDVKKLIEGMLKKPWYLRIKFLNKLLKTLR